MVVAIGPAYYGNDRAGFSSEKLDPFARNLLGLMDHQPNQMESVGGSLRDAAN